uniref:Uncharacterized protein n=1 Tax=Octopus bimaculoides TaxID=37653 RepID=A0A0L8GXA8_OCTBM
MKISFKAIKGSLSLFLRFFSLRFSNFSTLHQLPLNKYLDYYHCSDIQELYLKDWFSWQVIFLLFDASMNQF